MRRFEILRSAAVDVVLDMSTGVPSIVYWGAPLGVQVTSSDLSWMFDEVQVPGSLDMTRTVPIVPMHGDGFPGRPGLQGHRRGGRHWAARFSLVEADTVEAAGTTTLTCRSHDPVAQLLIETEIRLEASGILSLIVSLVNVGDSPYMVDALTVSVPFPRHVEKIGTFSGRWVREFQFERHAWMTGAWTAENRTGRTSHEHPPFIWLLDDTASEFRGDVWALHCAWSGNHVTYAERLVDGRRYVQMGELFHPGEICLDPGQKISTPSIIGVHSSHGINVASHMFHDHVRELSPPRDTPRPVHLNTWEAVYFDHDVERLCSLADVAAKVGVERFVLDDGWFGGRRNDAQGLGDWFVSPDVYPNGLSPLIDHVRNLGMEFGIWVEPEMANPDSEILAAHPDWVLATAGYEAVLGRNQVVLDLSRPDVFDHLFGRLDDLLRDHEISYVKWDMNRPLVQGSNEHGKSSGHEQVRQVYRLFDRLREQHPSVEFESCASGGGRIDFEILKRVERVWTSDSNDALERQLILRGASMVLPLRVLGSHIGPSPSHTTRRRHSMAFRGATAIFGHLGIEADLLGFDDRELSDVARVIDVYKRYRELIHGGDFVRLDTGIGHDRVRGTSAHAHGVLSKDRRQAIVSIAQLSTESSLTADHLRIPGLLPDENYQVEFVPLSESQTSELRIGPAMNQPAWLTSSVAGNHVVMSGRALAEVGLFRPVMWPESAIVVHLSCA
ncbi:MAG: alpha-galactosidase [Actinomycetota bacterium]